MTSVPTEKGEAMTDREKLALIKRLVLNINPLDFTDEKAGLGAGHVLAVAIECIIDMKGGDKND